MSVANHYAAGFGLGLLTRWLPYATRVRISDRLVDWAWKREEAQNLEGQDPNFPLSEHQQREAAAWGNGYARAAGLARTSTP